MAISRDQASVTSRPSGSTGKSYSANKQAVPAAGLGYALLATVPVNKQRDSIEIANLGADMCQVVLDDGAGGEQDSFFLAGSSNGLTPGQGAGWSSDRHRGRILVYGITGRPIYIREF